MSFIVVICTLVSAGVVGLFSSIGNVAGSRRFAQIVPAIIKRVSVAMIDIFVSLQNHLVHEDIAIFFSADGVVAVPSTNKHCTPIPLIQPVVVDGIDDDNLSFRQRNQLNGFVNRLNNFASFQVAFHRKLLSTWKLSLTGFYSMSTEVNYGLR
jgi:hypothetical protein